VSKLTDAELAAMPPKAVRYAEEVKLYQDNDFMTAYALHTDKRIAETGAQAAIGGGDNWEYHGNLQRDFLIKRGLKPGHKLLDIGCGTGRLARKIVPYLEPGNYFGTDISKGALRAACDLSVQEGWSDRYPTFALDRFPGIDFKYDFAWAFSVLIHLPYDICLETLERAASRMTPDGQILFSYVPEERPWRSGLKQFRHTLEDSQRMCADAGLTFEDCGDWIRDAGYEPGRWSGSQRIACARRIA
jgi:SAM-dependent methyltransferase